MGVGNRAKKQGPPPPLDESLVTRKRKNPAEKTNGAGKRRKKGVAGSDADTHKPTWKNEDASNSRNPRIHPADSAMAARSETFEDRSKRTNKAKKTTSLQGIIPRSEEDVHSDDSDGIDDPDVLEDEYDTVDVAQLEAVEGLDQCEPDLDDDGFDSDVVSPVNEKYNGMWSDEDDDNAADMLNAANIEGVSRHLDAKAAQEAADAQAELEEAALQTNIAGEKPILLEGNEAGDEEPSIKARLAPDLQLLRTRITDSIRILDEFSSRGNKERSRADYIQSLLKDMCAYYGYSVFLCEKLFNLFPPREAFAFFEANETPRPIVIRTNTLRTHRRELAQALINRGVTLEPVGKWSKIGLQIFESTVPLGATPEYLAGHYILQAASSFLPVMALEPQEHERILDMASAPGGKVTHVAALMKNTGIIFANDSNKARAKALIGNIHRLGAKNTIVCNYDAREFPRIIGGFDRVLLDAPCSGTGVIAKDASIKTNKTEKDFMFLPHLQKQLILCAIDSVDYASKTGGYIVYSTCSVTVEENEQVVQYALNKRPNVKLVDTGLVFGKEGFTSYMAKKFSPDMKLTRRYYPHAYNVDGFFVAKFKKIGATKTAVVNVASLAANGIRLESNHPSIPASFGTNLDEGSPDKSEDGFGGWDEEEDQLYIERAKSKSMRRKGLNPKATRS